MDYSYGAASTMTQTPRTTIYASTSHLKQLAGRLSFKQQRGQAAGDPSLSALLQSLDTALAEYVGFSEAMEQLMRDYEVTGR